MKKATVDSIESLLRVNNECASEIMRCIVWGMSREALDKADKAMGDFGVAHLKKEGALPVLITDKSFYSQFTALYVDTPSPNVPTLLYDTKSEEFYVMPLSVWLNIRGYAVAK